ncbi:hypothetical protein KUF71_008668 [Frankliniella fusca]|uniref:Uncharacterized protein n=1 Tax=Frankliniella fusca TaxID=407009 RepID=A0AAE1HDU2_9NEOP|nr:hypothetical protein KUF71_008668 [Frankliniella fusca]
MDQDLQRRIAERSPDALYEIKTLLRSRCTDKQLSAANVLETCLRAERITSKCLLRDFMLEEDLVGFLCDAMTTNSWPLLHRLTTVLELLTDSDKMLLEGHAVLAAEASQRRLHFLGLMVRSSAEWGPAQKRQGTHGVLVQGVSGLCPPMGMLSTLSLVLDAGLQGRTATTTTLSAAQTLCGLLHLVVVGVEPGDPSALAASVARCVRVALGSLRRALDTPAGSREDSGADRDDPDDTEMACELLCSLASHIINARVACEEALGPEDDALLVMLSLEDEAQAVVMDQCLPLVVKVATASTKESLEGDFGGVMLRSNSCRQPEDEDDADGLPALVGVLLDTLQAFISRGKDPVAVADQLVCQHFLRLLPALHQADCTNGAALRLTCAILAHLAHDLLDAGRWWKEEGGADSLAAFLYSAAPLLPAKSCEWPSVLKRLPYASPLPAPAAGPPPPAAAQLFYLMLSYFRSLVGG